MSTAEVHQHDKHDALIARCRELAPIPTAVAHPCDESLLSGAIDAAEAGIILPFSSAQPQRSAPSPRS
jgi:hypothetical protein